MQSTKTSSNYPVHLVLVIAALFLSGSTLIAEDAAKTLVWKFPNVKFKIGQQLPNFSLPLTTNSEPVPIYSLLKGKKTVLAIFASW